MKWFKVISKTTIYVSSIIGITVFSELMQYKNSIVLGVIIAALWVASIFYDFYNSRG